MRCLILGSAILATMMASASAATIEAASTIDAVTVYPDGATITRIIKANLPAGDNVLLARDFPLGLDPASLRVEGEGGAKVTIGSIDARPPAPRQSEEEPERVKRIQALDDERTAFENRIEAATIRRNFAKRFASDAPLGLGDEGDARPLSEWREAFKASEEEINSADEVIRNLTLKKRDIDAQIAILRSEQKADPAKKLEVRIDLASEAAASAVFRVTYAVRDARWTPVYDARLDTGTKDRKPALELVRRAEIVQRTGEDWANVALSVSTMRTARGGAAPNLATLIVNYPQPAPQASMVMPAPARPMAAASATRQLSAESSREKTSMDVIAEERSAVVETGGFQALFHLPGRISLGAGEGARSLRIAALSASPDLLVRAAPAVNDTAFLEASFKQSEEAPLLPGRVSLYRDGIFVGRGQMPLSPKDETVRLGFGADEQVKVTRIVARKSESASGIISSSKVDEREFKMTVRNGHSAPIRMTIEDQLPVTENAEIQVEMLSSSTAPTQRDVRDQRGVMAWTMDVPAGEAKEIKFGWRVKWPSDKSVVFSGGR